MTALPSRRHPSDSFEPSRRNGAGRVLPFRPDTAGHSDPPARPSTPHRVVSVSPGDVEPTTSHDHDAMSNTESIFLSPRVVDETSMKELVATLRDLVENAQSERSRLADAVESTRQAEDGSSDAARQLHERLSLGARMLRALQSQIDRLEGQLDAARERETTLESPDSAVESKVRGFEARLEKCLGVYEDRLNDVTERALARLERETDERREALRDRLRDVESQCRSCIDAIEEKSQGLREVGETLPAVQEARAELDGLLARLEPWSHLLLDEGGGGVHEQVVAAAESISRSVRAEMRRLAETFQAMAGDTEPPEEAAASERLAEAPSAEEPAPPAPDAQTETHAETESDEPLTADIELLATAPPPVRRPPIALPLLTANPTTQGETPWSLQDAANHTEVEGSD